MQARHSLFLDRHNKRSASYRIGCASFIPDKVFAYFASTFLLPMMLMPFCILPMR